MSQILCPKCKSKYEEKDLTLEYHKLGRQTKCPNCHHDFIIFKTPKNLIRNGDGTLIRRKNKRKLLKKA